MKHRKYIDLPLLVMALAATTAIGFFTGNQVYASRCRALGGRLMHSGADTPCMMPDRTTVRVEVLPSSPEGRAALVMTLAAAAGAIYLGLVRITRPARNPAP
jgi:hypothetical protein